MAVAATVRSRAVGAWLLERIRQIHAANRGVYGAPRVHAELRLGHDIQVGRKRVERLMRDAGLSGLVPKRRGRTTIRVPGVRVADDLVERSFRPTGPNMLWVADITYLRSWEGWLAVMGAAIGLGRLVQGWVDTDEFDPVDDFLIVASIIGALLMVAFVVRVVTVMV